MTMPSTLLELRILGFALSVLILFFCPIFLGWKSNDNNASIKSSFPLERVYLSLLCSVLFLLRYILDLIFNVGILKSLPHIGVNVIGIWMLVLLLNSFMLFHCIPVRQFEMIVCASEASFIIQILGLTYHAVNSLRIISQRYAFSTRYGLFFLLSGTGMVILSSFQQSELSYSFYVAGTCLQILSHFVQIILSIFILNEFGEERNIHTNVEFMIGGLPTACLVIANCCNFILGCNKLMMIHSDVLYYYNMPLWTYYFQNISSMLIYYLLSCDCYSHLHQKITSLQVSTFFSSI